jgi:hypothetical protein
MTTMGTLIRTVSRPFTAQRTRTVNGRGTCAMNDGVVKYKHHKYENVVSAVAVHGYG